MGQNKMHKKPNPGNLLGGLPVRDDDIEAERAAQKAEFLNREKRQKEKPSKSSCLKKPNKRIQKGISFEEKLGRTYQWLKGSFPLIFPNEQYIPLDILILMDLKNDYKNNVLKKSYPQDLVIKAALSRYKATAGYLACLKEGASRYNLKGEVSGMVTKEEAEEAKNILQTFKLAGK